MAERVDRTIKNGGEWSVEQCDEGVAPPAANRIRLPYMQKGNWDMTQSPAETTSGLMAVRKW